MNIPGPFVCSFPISSASFLLSLVWEDKVDPSEILSISLKSEWSIEEISEIEGGASRAKNIGFFGIVGGGVVEIYDR